MDVHICTVCTSRYVYLCTYITHVLSLQTLTIYMYTYSLLKMYPLIPYIYIGLSVLSCCIGDQTMAQDKHRDVTMHHRAYDTLTIGCGPCGDWPQSMNACIAAQGTARAVT